MKYTTAFGALGALLLGGCAPLSTTDLTSASTSTKADTLTLSSAEMARVQKAGAEILFWSDEQRSANFRRMEDIFPGTTAKASPEPLALPKGAPRVPSLSSALSGRDKLPEQDDWGQQA